jgi:hypothetical protein
MSYRVLAECNPIVQGLQRHRCNQGEYPWDQVEVDQAGLRHVLNINANSIENLLANYCSRWESIISFLMHFLCSV